MNGNLLDAGQTNVLRAESVPPNVVCTNTGDFLPRAQSEQPNFQQMATASPFRQYATPASVQPTANIPVYRGVAASSGGAGNIIAAPNIRLLRHNTLLNAAGRGYFDADTVPAQYSNNFLNGQAVADPTNILLNNSLLQANNHSHNNNNNAANNINNNLSNNNSNASPQCQTSPRFVYHNNNTAATNNANVTNQLQHHQPTNTLNNQINPLNPPLNNYADNFRR